MPEDEALKLLAERSAVADFRLEGLAAPTDEPIPDMLLRLLDSGRRLAGGPRAPCDDPPRDLIVCKTRALGQLLDRVPISVAAFEVHLRINAGWILAQHLLGNVDALEEHDPEIGRAHV